MTQQTPIQSLIEELQNYAKLNEEKLETKVTIKEVIEVVEQYLYMEREEFIQIFKDADDHGFTATESYSVDLVADNYVKEKYNL